MSEEQVIGVVVLGITFLMLIGIIMGAVYVYNNPYTGTRVNVDGRYVDILPEAYTLEHAKEDMEDLLAIVILSGILMLGLGVLAGALLGTE